MTRSLKTYFRDLAMSGMDTEQRKKWLYGQFHRSTESQSNRMDQYKEFCRLRDYRKPGVDVPQYTEAEAFAMATSKCEECPHAITKAAPNE